MITKCHLPYNGPNNALRHEQLWRNPPPPPHQAGYNYFLISSGTEAVQVMAFLRDQKIDVGYCAGFVGFKNQETRDHALVLMADTTTDSAMPAIAAEIRARTDSQA